MLHLDDEAVIATDLDRDVEADQGEFGVFQRCIRGEERTADPMCADRS
jgi:hypothetical protein